MKVFIVTLKDDPNEKFLIVKKAHVTPENREALRKHIVREYTPDFVWFEDEDPPNEVMNHLIKLGVF